MSVTAYVPGLGTEDPELYLNVSNTNWYRLMQRLGTDLEPWGSLSGPRLADLRVRVQATLAVIEADPAGDVGMPPMEEVGGMFGLQGVTIIDCGLSAGYYTARLSTLLRLIEEAEARGSELRWD